MKVLIELHSGIAKLICITVFILMPSFSMAITAGNPAGKVILTEYFDYQCIHCRRMANVVNNLIKNNHDLHVEYRALPVFGYMSLYEAKAAIASLYQNKYAEFRKLLMNNIALRPGAVLFLAEEADLNIVKLKKNINDKQVIGVLKDNIKSFEMRGFKSIPIFILKKAGSRKVSYLFSGEQSYAVLQHAFSNLD